MPDGPVKPDETGAAVRAALNAGRRLPETGADPGELIDTAANLLFDHSVFNGHPRFLGYITSSPAPIGVLGDFLASAVNQNCGGWMLAPMATEIEAQTVRWIAELIGFPSADTGSPGVLVSGGKVAAVGAGGKLKAPAGARTVDGRGKSLVPGLWDAHRHLGDDWNLLGNVATGVLNYRSPGTMIERAQSVVARRAKGDLIAPDGKVQVILDRKDPLAAQGALTASSAAEAISQVRKIKAAGMWGVKFYTSMTPAWIAPAAAEAHRLGLHVSGHVPAGMRPLDAVRAGYDEVTHINFVMMQAMPQAVVDKANTAARLEGPAQYGNKVDLKSPAMRA
jgi:hypothetical protein